MAQESRIIRSWSLSGFALEFGKKVATGECINAETGKCFHSVAFTATSGQRTFVNFSKNLGVLSGREIAQKKDGLQIVQLKVDQDVLERRKANGKQLESYILCNVGESSWEEVDLGL
jgi:hypothetical protein